MRRLTACITLALIAAGCSYYSVSGSLPSHIKTCAVPLFENETVEAGIVEEITSQVVEAIIKDGAMKVVGEFQADAVVYGTIVDVIEQAETFSQDETAEQFKIRIFADVTFFDRRKNQAIWEEKNIEGWANYAATDISARDDGIEEALGMLAKEIIDKTVSGW